MGYLRFIDPAFALFVHGVGLMIFCILTATIDGRGGIACLFMVFLFESVCYPVIFSIATSNLGSYAKFGGGLIAMGVSGGAWYPSAQGAVADAKGTQISYMIPFTGFVPLMLYGLVMWAIKCRRHNKWSVMVRDLDGSDQAIIEEDLRKHSQAAGELGPGPNRETEEEKADEEFVDLQYASPIRSSS